MLLPRVMDAAGGNLAPAIPVACALELIHTYSLIHDDLPAMDNDDFRRGKPTSHKVFGEALAILAGDALLTEAFVLLSRTGKIMLPAEKRLSVIREIAYAAGISGMVGGQALDILSENMNSDENILSEIHRRKTGALIVASVKAGAIVSGAGKNKTLALSRYGLNLGLAFQIADDILNVTGDSAIMGKKTGSDVARGKLTYPSVLGMDAARQKLQYHVDEAIASLTAFDERARPLRVIARYIENDKNKFCTGRAFILVKQQETVDYSVLQKIEFPQDLRKLSIAELNTLAQEVRRLIIDTVALRGGHLASSLGAVELALALHFVFNTPQDKIIWDVGHQSYAHKIITGRKESFSSLRLRGGISGFPRREESIYDVFNVGHSGTSISAAAGFAQAKCLKGEKDKIIAVIGDGSMTTGMAFEALNWAGDSKKDMIIVLNDNEMSISPNVGALSSYLNRIMTGHRVTKFKADVKGFLKNIPGIGEHIVKFSEQIEESLKTFVVPGGLFEEMGFTYVGPLEGHRLDYLIKNFENVKNLEGPVLVHVITQKGKGYKFAEEKPLSYHGIAPLMWKPDRL